MFVAKPRPSGKMFGVVSLTLLALFFTGCDSEVEEPNATITVPEDVAPVEEPVVQTEEIPETPIITDANSSIEELVGETVTVSTKVQEEVSDGVFTAYDVESMRGEEILVISDMMNPAVGSNIEVTGEVRPFDVAAIESEYGVDLPADLETEFVGKPYIAAMAMEPVD